jgi:hypothetical protein
LAPFSTAIDTDQNIRDTRNIARVMREGTILDRNKLKLDPAVDPGYQPIGGMASRGTEIIPGQVCLVGLVGDVVEEWIA